MKGRGVEQKELLKFPSERGGEGRGGFKVVSFLLILSPHLNLRQAQPQDQRAWDANPFWLWLQVGEAGSQEPLGLLGATPTDSPGLQAVPEAVRCWSRRKRERKLENPSVHGNGQLAAALTHTCSLH